jgi:lysophospholipase L1-like esterase
MKSLTSLLLCVLSVLCGGELLHAQDKGPIVFVGSSIFHRWIGLERQMAPLPIYNVAFDGAQTRDWIELLKVRVIPPHPKVVVYYCGSNDVDAGAPVPDIYRGIQIFATEVLRALPESRFVFVSVIRAPEKRDRWDAVDRINEQMREFAKSNPRAAFVDVNPIFVNADGSTKIELFMNDQLHLRPPAYDEFTKILKPVLTEAIR